TVFGVHAGGDWLVPKPAMEKMESAAGAGGQRAAVRIAPIRTMGRLATKNGRFQQLPPVYRLSCRETLEHHSDPHRLATGGIRLIASVPTAGRRYNCSAQPAAKF